jgi:hypothetical protein
MAVDPTNPSDGELNPVLENTLGQFSDPQAQAVATDAVTAIQQHVNMTTVADTNAAAGQQFVNNLAATKNNLVGMVQADPTSIDLALRLTQQLIPPLLTHANVDADIQPDVHSAIIDHFNQQIVHAAGIRAADFSPDMVQGIIDKYGDHLDEGDADTLTRYANAMQGSRDIDHSLGTAQAIADRQRGSQLTAYAQGSQLLDNKREVTQFPDDFVANLTRDTSMNPADKTALYTAVTHLAANGDQPTNPYTFMQRLRDVVDPGTDVAHDDLMQHVGNDLSYADAHMLQGLNLTATPAGNGMAKQLSDTVTSAQQYLAGSGSRAGDAAFGRFMDWLLPSYRSVGAAGLDPGNDSYLFANTSLSQFRSHEDAVPSNMDGRPALGQIFAQNGPAEEGATSGAVRGIDPAKVQRLRNLEQDNVLQPEMQPGTFFQRKLEESGGNG